MLHADLVRQQIGGKAAGQHRMHCPACHPSRKNKQEQTLSVEIAADHFKWNCWHCQDAGRGWMFERIDNRRYPVSVASLMNQTRVVPMFVAAPALLDLSMESLAFLASRGISKEAADRYGVKTARRFFKALDRETEALAFTTTVKGKIISVKYRSIEGKAFSSQGSQVSYWGLDQVSGAGPLIITEGELDALACATAGIVNVVSVPSGASVSTTKDAANDGKYGFIQSAERQYDELGRVVVFTDADEAGGAFASEIARRVGKHRCLEVILPVDCKDANDVLIKHGPEKLVETVASARLWPVAGLYEANHYSDKLYDIYENGVGSGLSTGLWAVDDIYTIVPGQVTVVTGVPSSGKSEFVDQIIVNLARSDGWKFCVASFENPPHLHIVKLMEKYKGKPFFKGDHPRLTPAEVEDGTAWVNKNFFFIEAADGLPSTIDTILDRAKVAVMRHGCRGLVIDPYNYIERLDAKLTETEQVSDMLSKVRRFAVGHDVHIWFVAHPAKLHRGEGGDVPIPSGYDILGSSHWFNKADIGLTVHRERETAHTLIRIWKARFKWVARNGDVLLLYDVPTGRYSCGAKGTSDIKRRAAINDQEETPAVTNYTPGLWD